MTVDMTPVRSPRRSKMPRARSRTCRGSTSSGPICRLDQQGLDVGARSDRGHDLAGSAGQDLAGEPRAPAREVDHPDLAKRSGQAAIVAATSLGELDGPAIRLLGAVQVDLASPRRRMTRRAGPQQCLAELQVRPELGARRRRARGREPGRASRAPRRRPRPGSSAAPTRAAAGRRARSRGPASPRPARPARSGHRVARRSCAGRHTRRRGSTRRIRRSAGRSRPPGVPDR